MVGSGAAVGIDVGVRVALGAVMGESVGVLVNSGAAIDAVGVGASIDVPVGSRLHAIRASPTITETVIARGGNLNTLTGSPAFRRLCDYSDLYHIHKIKAMEDVSVLAPLSTLLSNLYHAVCLGSRFLYHAIQATCPWPTAIEVSSFGTLLSLASYFKIIN